MGLGRIVVYKLNFMNKYSVGIDISKNDFHACFSGIDNNQQVKVLRSGTFKNNRKGFVELAKWTKDTAREKIVPVVIIMEATGVYFENCALYLFKSGFNVSVILPNKAKKYIAALGIKTKNDKADAKALSRMGAEQALQLWQPMDDYFYELRALTRLYQTLQESITATKNQLEAAELSMYPSKTIIRSLKKLISETEKQLLIIRDKIYEHLASNRYVATKVNNIAEIKGVAALTIAVLAAETNGFLLFENASQLVSYAGYDVVESQSGLRVGKTKISKKGNARIRRALHMPALNVVRYKVKKFDIFFERNFQRHGIKMKSYVAVQKKLLTTIYALWKKGEKFDPEYDLKNTTRDGEAVQSSRPNFTEVG